MVIFSYLVRPELINQTNGRMNRSAFYWWILELLPPRSHRRERRRVKRSSDVVINSPFISGQTRQLTTQVDMNHLQIYVFVRCFVLVEGYLWQMLLSTDLNLRNIEYLYCLHRYLSTNKPDVYPYEHPKNWAASLFDDRTDVLRSRLHSLSLETSRHFFLLMHAIAVISLCALMSSSTGLFKIFISLGEIIDVWSRRLVGSQWTDSDWIDLWQRDRLYEANCPEKSYIAN